MTTGVRGNAKAPQGRRLRLSRITPKAGSGSTALGLLAARRRRGSSRTVWIPGVLLFSALVASAVSMALTPRPTPKPLVVLFLVRVLFPTAGLYRPRLSLSVLDDAPDILG